MLQTISWKGYLITVGVGVVFYYGWWLVRYYPGLKARRPGGNGGLQSWANEGPAEDVDFVGLEGAEAAGAMTGDGITGIPASDLEPPQAGQLQGLPDRSGVSLDRLGVSPGQPGFSSNRSRIPSDQSEVLPDQSEVSPDQLNPSSGRPAFAFPAANEGSGSLPVIASNLKKEIYRLLEKAAKAEAGKADVLEQLHQLLTADPYPILKGTGFQEQVHALIVREMGRYGSIPDDPGVMRELWNE